MIVVCEPQCKGISHEKVNSGFLYGLHLAYPKEKILFFADTAHFRELNDLFKDNHISTDNFKHLPISINSKNVYGIGGILRNYLLFKKVFNKVLRVGSNKVFLLSTSPIILYVIKKLKQQKKYKDICCTFVLHGELEDIAHKNYEEPYKPVLKGVKIGFKRVVSIILNHPDRVFFYSLGIVFRPFLNLYSKYSLIFKKKFRVKKMMMWRHSDQYKYISLSPHVTKNASKHIDTKYLNFHTIVMPIIYPKPYMPPKNKNIKFAIFGYGDSAQLHKMLILLSKKNLRKSYEIRIISMDDRGTEGFKNITHVGNGSVLTRKEMEVSARDIDVFINLYDKSRHSLGCSLSIFEALSYLKPILHLSNPGYNYFNKLEKPIGYRCENLDGFVNKMSDMVENYPKYMKELDILRKNMVQYRKEYNIKNNLSRLKESFTFS